LGEKSFVVPLGDSDSDRYRLYCVTERGRVALFRVQYEAFIDSKWQPIVRYDTAHGFPHRDLLHRDRPEAKTEYPGRFNAEVLTLGQEDIKRNWQTYRARYEEEMNK
jgi:hypothetical protein